MKYAYIGIGAAAALLCASAAHAQIRLCTGGEGLPYHQAGEMIAKMANGTVEVIKDTGGTWGNIERTVLGDGCDAMIGQPDGAVYLKRTNPAAAANLKPIGDLHREYLHVVCSKESGVEDLSDLESDPKGNGYSVALGDTGSGSWLIWQNIIAEDEDYGAVPVKNESGVIALASVAANETTCALQPAALGNSFVKQADVDFGESLVLAGAADKDFNDAVDTQGKPLYTWAEIPSGTYPANLQGWWSAKETLSWTAKVYVNPTRITDKKVLEGFITAVARARPAIVAQYGK